MSQFQRTIEHLMKQGILPITHADAAATHLGVYPSKRTWLTFFDKALLIIGAVALVLSLVFFVAYNWQTLGKMGKFALVESALVMTIALYVALFFGRRFRQRFRLIRQLLLLIASIITGSLLALFGQVYQTGADTWQLFFVWALLITPWVVIAYFPALWLLWLGLINASLLSYFEVIGLPFLKNDFQELCQITVLALVNLVALYGWLTIFEHKRALPSSQLSSSHANSHTDKADNNPTDPAQTTSALHWSTYVVGLVGAIFMTSLALIAVFDNRPLLVTFISLTLWLGWCGFMVWQFYKRRIDLLMLTYLAFSLIAVLIFWASKGILDVLGDSGFLALALLLIALSSAAILWLRKATLLDDRVKTDTTQGGANDE
ncbi:DUF2157 domain-containing protein [Psychrobacter sp. B38]|uniref:DUF2157 domain-containing protein n=1 Tax=Psychrobacter sp. B38 TaxID=3143538 RepID=UPI00320C80B5